MLKLLKGFPIGYAMLTSFILSLNIVQLDKLNDCVKFKIIVFNLNLVVNFLLSRPFGNIILSKAPLSINAYLL